MFGFGRKLRRRYGHSKRYTGSKITRKPGKMYYVKGNGEVWEADLAKRRK
jgi:hypothetical protein